MMPNTHPSMASQLSPQRNALLPGASVTPAAPQANGLSPAFQSRLLGTVIGHAAVLSDTPEKWASTIDLLKQNGVDPAGYEDFGKGRKLAIAAAGRQPLPGESDLPPSET